MDLRWLEDAIILLEEGNMTRASDRRGVTQPAFSRRIRALETWLGAPILKRHANRVDIEQSLSANEQEIRTLIERLQDLRKRIAYFDPEHSTLTIAIQHSLIFSAFPELVAFTRTKAPAIDFRLRAGNHSDCTSMFLRGYASALLCYERPNKDRLPFDETVLRQVWGSDRLVPVIGGSLRYIVDRDTEVPEDTPALVFPEQSFFGNVLRQAGRPFSTRAGTISPVCETAFSIGIKELALKGIGTAWAPMSLCVQEIESGQLINLSYRYGSVPLEIALYTKREDEITRALEFSR